MQSLEIISVNVWQMLISLLNLAVLYLILRFFLYKPVRKMLSARRKAIDETYETARLAQQEAEENKERYAQQLSHARSDADEVIRSASELAAKRGESIVSDAKQRAEGIVRQAERDADLEKRKARGEIKREVAELSVTLAEKMLRREIDEKDQRNMIDSFFEEIGDGHDEIE